ncbi:MAG: CTP-dependent riboflavin kinase [Candidatus Poseidoniaceae archaeon]|nr:CTP-dependent riboflavin kinase [Candidatus Poseidoniaceae archaeon]
MLLAGIVSSGLGRAHIFMAQPHYQKQFNTLLGSNAWAGTLNVKVTADNLVEYKKLRVVAGLEEGVSADLECVRINGFERDGKSFGGATAFLAEIFSENQTHDCAVLIPDLTRHEDVVEVISSVFLRESCDLLDGDKVSISLQ